MSEPFIGQIQAFGFNFAPRGWAKCDGALLPINSNSALFSLLGTIYGGDGRTTFALPDLRGRAPVHQGRGSGLTNRLIGQRGGVETHTLTLNELPSHNHGLPVTSGVGNQASPVGAIPATSNDGESNYSTNGPSGSASPDDIKVTPSGGGQPHENLPPYLTVNFCIALVGIYPSRS